MIIFLNVMESAAIGCLVLTIFEDNLVDKSPFYDYCYCFLDRELLAIFDCCLILVDRDAFDVVAVGCMFGGICGGLKWI